MTTNIVDWKLGRAKATKEAVFMLLEGGKAIVTPTKVGYIVIAIDRIGLEKMFELKGRPKSKPGVVLCSSAFHTTMYANTDISSKALYARCQTRDILLGCILPWGNDSYIPDDFSSELIQDSKDTSCFVINFGAPSELIVDYLWKKHRLLAFASSANPSGTGNRGRLEGVGERILSGADLIVEADDYVKSCQPDKDESTRYEQGTMVSMVDKDGDLKDIPTVIRKGLDVNRIMGEMSNVYNSFDYRHGDYH